MPFTVKEEGTPSCTRYVTVMVTGEPGLTVPLDSLTLTPDGAETLNEIGPLAALTVNEPLQMLELDSAMDTVPGDSLRTGGGGGGFGFGGGEAFGAGDFAGADDAGGDGCFRPGADDFAAGADEPGDGDTPPGGAEIGRAGSGLGRPG
jgi:hypothetical protein